MVISQCKVGDLVKFTIHNWYGEVVELTEKGSLWGEGKVWVRFFCGVTGEYNWVCEKDDLEHATQEEVKLWILKPK